MRFVETDVAGVIVVEPDVHRDARGFFLETFHAGKYAAAGHPASVRSGQPLGLGRAARCAACTCRCCKPQGKLVRVIEGEIWDVALDVRPDSPTFMRWTAETLSADNFRQLYIPPGCAHGFCVHERRSRRCSTSAPSCTSRRTRSAIAWNDPEAAIHVADRRSAAVGARSGEPVAARGAGRRWRSAAPAPSRT